MAQFLQSNPAVFAAVLASGGAVLGVILTFVGQWFLRKREIQMKIWDRFLDRRFSAHENVIGLAMKMRVMVSLGGFDQDRQLVRAPQIMESKESFDEWLVDFAKASAPANTWLATAVKRELNFVQDYMVTLHTHLSAVPPEGFLQVGHLIRDDFIDLSSKLEKAAFDYFQRDATKLHLGDLAEHHKYAPEETERRFQNTVMLSKWTEVQKVIRSGQESA